MKKIHLLLGLMLMVLLGFGGTGEALAARPGAIRPTGVLENHGGRRDADRGHPGA